MFRKLLVRLLITAAIGLASWLIYRTLSQQSLDAIVSSIMQIPAGHLLAGIGFVFLSYFCLTLFDALAIRYVGRELAYPQVAIASFTSLSIGHNVGGAALSSGAIRYRFYSRWGLSAEEVAKVILFCGITVGLGLVTLAGLCCLIMPGGAARITGFSRTAALLLGTTCIAATIGYVALAHFLRASVRVFRWTFKLPSSRIAACQVIVGTANFLCVSACLHQLLLTFGDPSFLDTATAYVGANVAALFSHVPGGIGVLEATIAFLLGQTANVGALIAFRAIYFFLPLPLGLISLSIAEFGRQDDGRSLANKAKT
ncbi:Inner membrane protein YbhN [Ensifer psoraleae]|uniref:lysylphosphatidylglycerol synthase domain-containing protein n=1 Tax=Sinorhizobium psoraleae TaxID=520838 RepID=UPI00156A053B|nr:lysylphosphatidylglycerol synthase domain-containing protein [Sinorhizobium psoraleae]NRP74278.1 Inner membrane protein YbhN [Sinorhizobium psoraleae]